MIEHVFNPSPILARSIKQVDKVWIDPWSGIHSGAGILLGLLNVNIEFIFLIVILWEVIENSILGVFIWDIAGEKYTGDTQANIVTDIIFVTLFAFVPKKFDLKCSYLLLGLCFIYYEVYISRLRNDRSDNEMLNFEPNTPCFCTA